MRDGIKRGAMMKVLTFLGIAGLCAIYFALSEIANLPGAKVDESMKIETQRKGLLLEVEADQKGQATSYGWVNEEEGVVRIPIERAMEVYVKEGLKNEG